MQVILDPPPEVVSSAEAAMDWLGSLVLIDFSDPGAKAAARTVAFIARLHNLSPDQHPVLEAAMAAAGENDAPQAED